MPPSRGHARSEAARATPHRGGVSDTARSQRILAASWERSRAAGVDVENPTTDFTDDIDTTSRLVRCAEPVVARLSSHATNLPISVAVTDSRARVIVRADACTEVGRSLDRVEFAPGFAYAESTMGTNGVGTVIEAGQPVSVVGADHFTERLRPFACTGAPIIDPLTGRAEGILDISTLVESWIPHMATLVRSAAHDIGRNLLLDRNRARQALFEAYLVADARSTRRAVMAFAESVFMSSAAAQSLLSEAEQVAIREHAAFALGGRDTANETVTLSTGRVMHLRCTRVTSGVDTAGVVVMAAEATAGVVAAHKQASPPVLAPGVPAGTSPAWLRACDQLSQALARRRRALVIGESGTGKATAATGLFHAQHPGARIVTLEAAGLMEVDVHDPSWAQPSGGTAAPTLYLLRGLDQLDPVAVQPLGQLLTQVADKGRSCAVVATVTEGNLEADLPYRTLLRHFDVAVLLPPLRQRTEDLEVTIARLAQDLAPQRRVRFSPAATRLLLSYSWPGNITQVREALAHAFGVRPVGEIQEGDLPSYCHSATTKTLTVLESAERDAIVTALRDHCGNRVAAAKHLGIARSSLYRKIRSFGITV